MIYKKRRISKFAYFQINFIFHRSSLYEMSLRLSNSVIRLKYLTHVRPDGIDKTMLYFYTVGIKEPIRFSCNNEKHRDKIYNAVKEYCSQDIESGHHKHCQDQLQKAINSRE